MSDSALAEYIYPVKTSHFNLRDHAIDTVTIHHAANGTGCSKGTAPNTLAVIFASCGKGGSCNYGIDSNGRIGLMLSEKYRSWCSNSRSNDMRAVTVEVANCEGAPSWRVSDKAMKALIALCADICRRNGKSRMVWIPDKTRALNYTPRSGEMRMTLHTWVSEAPTGCPGEYLISKMQYIADEVNRQLGAPEREKFTPYMVRITHPTGMNIRKSPGVSSPLVRGTMCVYRGIYTIVEEQTVGGQIWGRLKSGAGWICLSGFTERYR
ncbi:MAG: N-acetylmuramoyl-L-alanine amidase [Ruminococcus sp.]|nr:N-acetylmuramoyl-L-alanine amidase [Ruminococcus sp.]